MAAPNQGIFPSVPRMIECRTAGIAQTSRYTDNLTGAWFHT